MGKTAEQFAALRNEPLSGVLKLNDGMNFLTESTYRQIKSLEEQGRTADAARVAQEAYANALTGRSAEIERNLGGIERGWNAIADAAKKGWDNMLGVGRAQTTQDRLKQVRAELEAVEKQLDSGKGFVSTDGGAAYGNGRGALNPAAQKQLRERIGALGAEAAALEGVAHAEKVAAEEAAKRAEQMRGRAQWDKEGVKYLSEQAKLTRALTEAENEGRNAGASDAEIKKRQADMRAEFSKKATSANQSEIAGIRAKIIAEQEYIDRLRERGVAADKVTEGERLTAKIQQELEGKLDAKTRALKEQELVEAQRLATLNKVRASEEQRVKAIAESEAAYRKFIDSIVKAGDAIDEQAAKQEAANATFGKGKTAIEEMALAQQKLALASEKDAGPWDPARIAAMEVAITQQERYVRALQAGDVKVVDQHTDELLRNAKEMAALYEDESRLIGLSALERAKIVALRQVELKYAKELARIKEMPEGTASQIAAKEQQRLKVLEAKQIESQAAVSKVIEEDWNKTSQLIGDTLSDYIMGGGKDAAQYLKRLFATLVLQPQVQMLVGGLLGGGGASGALGGGGGGVGNVVSGATSLIRNGLNVAGMGGKGMQALADMAYNYGLENVGELVDSFRFGMMDTASWAGFQEAFQQGGARLAGAVAGSVLNGFSGYGISRLVSGGYQVNPSIDLIGGIASAIPGVGPIAGLISGAVNRLFGRKLKDQGIVGDFGGDTGFEGQSYQYYKGGLFRSNKTKYGELDEELRSALGDQFNAMRVGATGMADVLGLSTDAIDKFTASIKVSFNGLDEAGIQEALKAEFDKVAESLALVTLGTTEYNRAGETSVEALTRLSGSLVAVNGIFENLGTELYATSLAGADMASSLVDLFGGADGFNSATGSYFQNFYSPEEQRAAMERQLQQQLSAMNITLPDIDAADARAQYRALAEAQDLTTESGRKTWAMLIQLAGAFAGVTAEGENAAAAEIERQKKVADQRLSLEERLLKAGGDDRGALDMRRKQEYDALYKLDPALAHLVAQIYALEDASAIASKRFDVEQRLLIAQGKEREALDLRRGQEYDALYKLDPALANMIAQVWALEDAAQAVADKETARNNAMRDLSDAMGRQTEIWENQLSAIDTQRQVQQEALGLITGIFDLVRSNARDLYGEVQSTAAMQAAQGNAFIAQALATAKKTGYLPEQDALQQAISGARSGLDNNNFASQVDADFARLVLAGQLKGLEEIAGPQKTAAEQQLDRLDAQTDALNKQIREQQKQYDLIQRQIDIENGTYNATITVAEATAKIIELLGGKAPEGVGSGAVDNGGAAWGGSAAGGGASAPSAKYSRMFWIGTGAGYEGITDQSVIERLDKLASVYHAFDGTRDLVGLGTAFKGAGGTIADLSILSGNWEADWRKAFASVGLPSFAVGTNYVPQDMVAQIHKGERIVPEADNRALMAAVSGGGQRSEMAAVVAELREVKAQLAAVRAATESTAGNTSQLAEQTDSVTEGGNGTRVEIMNVSALAKALAEEMAA